MDLSPRCAYCGQPQPPALRQEFGLWSCERCAAGGAEAALRERGHAIGSREWTTPVRSQSGGYDVHHMSVDASPRDTLAVTASFTRERALHKLIKLVRREIEIGERLFDDFVYVDTRERPQTLLFLREPGVQAALIDLVGRFDLVELRRGVLRIRHSAGEPVHAAAAILPACALLVHLERLAGEAK